MTPEMKCTSNRSVDENPLYSTGSISLDMKPVAQAIASVSSGIRKEIAAYRKQTGELAMMVNATNNDITKNAKLLLGLQRCLQSLEEEQRKISEQNIRARFMKPLARKLLGLRASAAELMD
jgi:cell division septum initiation protein DivIVA